MKKLILATAIAVALTSGIASAQTAPAAPEAKKPDHEVSYNLGVASEYRYRGITQSRFDPALQGGADYTHNPTGLYAGTWLSSIKWVNDAGGGNKNVEVDLYAGKKGDLGKGFSYDVGGLYYWYPDNKLGDVSGFKNGNTFELYGKVAYGPGYVKYSHSLTNLFGFVDSKNSGYLDVGADFDLGKGYTLNLHAGHQWIKNNSDYNYSDYKIGVTKEFFGVGFNLAVIGTDAEKALYRADNKFSGKTALVLTATKTF